MISLKREPVFSGIKQCSPWRFIFQSKRSTYVLTWLLSSKKWYSESEHKFISVDEVRKMFRLYTASR